MHDAFRLETILELPKTSVATLHAYANKLLLVDSQYTLIHYQVSESKSTATSKSVDGVRDSRSEPKVLQTIKSFCRSKPIGLHAIKETQMLLVLVDSYLSIYSLLDLSLVQKLPSTKAATTFSVWSGVDHSSGIPVLSTQVAVCVKRQVLLFTWLDSEFEGEKHFDCPDRGKSIEFLTNTILVVAMSNDYVTIDLKEERVEVLQVPMGGSLGTVSTTMGYLGTRSPKSILTRTSEHMLLVKDVQSCFIDSAAEVMKTKSPNWTSAPEFVGFTYPYLIVVLKHRVEIRNSRSGSVLQVFDIAGVQVLNDGKSLFLATLHKILRLNAISYAHQVEQLIERHQLIEALSLLEILDPVLLDDKAGLIRRVKELTARQRFEKEDFDGSMELFGESWTIPSIVVELLPQKEASRPSSASTHTQELVQEEEFADNAAVAVRTSIDESSRSAQKVTETIPAISDLKSATSKAAFRAMSTYLARSRRLLSRFISSPPSAESEEQYFTPWPSSMALTQAQMEVELGIADTALLRIYIQNSPGLVGSLVRLTNRCDPDVVKDYLVKEDRWKELVDFYYGKGLHKEALSLLQDKDAVDTGIQYLQRLDVHEWPIIATFAPWVLRESVDRATMEHDSNDEKIAEEQTSEKVSTSHENAAMDIFMDSSRESDSFDRSQVVEFLTSVDATFAIQYLEFIILSRGDATPHFSEDLIYLYIDTKRVNELSKFMESESNTASAARIYSHIPHTAEFNEIRAQTLAKMGNLRRALEIFVRKIRDPQKSEEFASKQFSIDCNSYEILLTLYLTPPTKSTESQEIQVEAALDLLMRHGPRLDADQVMSSLPPSTSLASISEYLKARLGSNLLTNHSLLIESKLREASLLRLQMDVIDRRKKYWEVGVDRVCGVCHKRLGNSVLAVFPDGGCVHYGCQKRYHVEQVT